MIKMSVMRYLLLICALCILSKVSAQKYLSANKYKLYILDYGMSGMVNFNGSDKLYININAYLVNNSNDTLYYWGTDCRYTQFFRISKNPYLYIKDQDCKKQRFIKYSLPPHRSQKINIVLSKKKEPDTIIPLKVSMKLFRWTTKASVPNNKYLISVLSDLIILKFNAQHNSFATEQDFEVEYQKEKLIPADLDLYLLTDKDRKSYTITVDQRKISAPRDTKDWNKKRVKTFNVPVSLNNTSNDTLKFLTMTCSWNTDFSTSNKNIFIEGWSCDSNFPEPITVPPHHNFLRIIPVSFYESEVKAGTKFKIGMSLTIPHGKNLDFNLYPDHTTRFNIIWSNEITVP